jgi:endonuclease/exonuclease/phosphatase family metal-dependent hydrolase
MRLITWNLNHRAGYQPFRLEAAEVASALGADAIIFTEYHPWKTKDGRRFSQELHARFRDRLMDLGFGHTALSPGTEERANRVLIVARLPFDEDALGRPTFDRQFPANIIAVRFPDTGLRVLGLRVPAYETKDRERLAACWAWLEYAARQLRGSPAVILGDLNVTPTESATTASRHFRRMLDSGWVRARPTGGFSYYGQQNRRSEIDHVLGSPGCAVSDAVYVVRTGVFELAGSAAALSDHAALAATIEVKNSLTQLGPGV